MITAATSLPRAAMSCSNAGTSFHSSGDDVAQRGGGLALAGRGGHGALVTGVDVVQPAVVVAVEPDHLGPAGGGPGHPQRGLHHLRAGTAEPHGLRPAEHGQHPFRRLDLPLVRGRVDDPMPLRGQHLLAPLAAVRSRGCWVPGRAGSRCTPCRRRPRSGSPAARCTIRCGLSSRVLLLTPPASARRARCCQSAAGRWAHASHRCLLWQIRPSPAATCAPRSSRYTALALSPKMFSMSGQVQRGQAAAHGGEHLPVAGRQRADGPVGAEQQPPGAEPADRLSRGTVPGRPPSTGPSPPR